MPLLAGEEQPAADTAAGMDAEQRFEQLGPAGAHQPGDAEDLATVQRERDRPDGTGAGLLARRQGQVLDAQDLLTNRRVGAREEIAERASDHHPDQLTLIRCRPWRRCR